MPTYTPTQDADPGKCLICGVSLDHREGPLWEIERLRAAILSIDGATMEGATLAEIQAICRKALA